MSLVSFRTGGAVTSRIAIGAASEWEGIGNKRRPWRNTLDWSSPILACREVLTRNQQAGWLKCRAASCQTTPAKQFDGISLTSDFI